MARVAAVAAVASIATMVAGALAVAHRVVFQSNHVGYSLFRLWPLEVSWIVVGLANVALGGRNRRIGILLLALCVLAPLCAHLLERFNLLVPYEEWLNRGMPPKPWEDNALPSLPSDRP